MAVRLCLGLAALLCLVGAAVACWPCPHVSEASRLERTCKIHTPDQWAMVPCFILDEYGQTEFRV